jgi:hypothetical protein
MRCCNGSGCLQGREKESGRVSLIRDSGDADLTRLRILSFLLFFRGSALYSDG